MFQAIVQASLRQRIAVLALSLVLILFGSFSGYQLSVDVLPDLNKPTVTIMTEAPGMAPEEVEQQVSFPIEQAVGGLPGVSRVRSTSSIGLSIVYVQFDWGSDIYRNRQQIAERLALIRGSLPDAATPQMGPVSSIMGEVMLIAAHSRDPAVGPMALRDYTDWVLRPRLLGLPGVSQVTTIGGEVRQYLVTPDPYRMQQLGISLGQLVAALRDFGSNTSGGFVEAHGSEYLVRHIGRTTRLEDLADLVVARVDDRSVPLKQVAEIGFGHPVKRGDGSYNGEAAVIISVQKQPDVDTLALTAEIDRVLAAARDADPRIALDPVFRQAAFINNSIDNLRAALIDAAIIVAIVLFAFLLNVRTTLISLTAIPLSVLATVLVFRYSGLSINTMTLGGLAIALGELVDDAVVGVENVLRRLRQNSRATRPRPLLAVINDATLEVRSGIYYATLIIVLVFVPLFALPGMEGRLFTSLGIAYIVSIVASLVVSITLTPVLCHYLLPSQPLLQRGDSPLLAWLKRIDARLLRWSFRRHGLIIGSIGGLTLAVLASAPLLPTTFLPSFNEGTLTVNLIARPGVSLSASNAIGQRAEALILAVPEVRHVGRRTGRAELDEHAEGVHYSEIDVHLSGEGRALPEVAQDIRQRLAALPVSTNIGQPISHRLDHLLSAVRADMVIKLYGPDLDILRALASEVQQGLTTVAGLVDLQTEQQVEVPQVRITLNPAAAQRVGLRPAELNAALATLGNGEIVSQILDGNRRHDLVLRLNEQQRSPEQLAQLLVETPRGLVPLGEIAQVHEGMGPNQINHESGQRRAVIYANAADEDLGEVLERVRAAVSEVEMPVGYAVEFEGRFQSQEDARQRVTGLALLSLLLIFAVLLNRYRSLPLSLMIMVNVPLALTGGIVALWLTGTPLSLASLVGFITLAGISARNGILKISHYINLVAREGEPFGDEMIVRGSLERLAPVFMTTIVTILALVPLLIAGQAPGKEILYPVAVVIFGGLFTSTLLDTILTPVIFHRWGEGPLRTALARRDGDDTY